MRTGGRTQKAGLVKLVGQQLLLLCLHDATGHMGTTEHMMPQGAEGTAVAEFSYPPSSRSIMRPLP